MKNEVISVFNQKRESQSWYSWTLLTQEICKIKVGVSEKLGYKNFPYEKYMCYPPKALVDCIYIRY